MEVDQKVLMLFSKFVKEIDNICENPHDICIPSSVTDVQKIALFAAMMQECGLRFITYLEEK